MPNTQLYICRGIPTDKTYNHVLRFQSDSSRFDYFTSKSVLYLTNYTYQRLERYLSVGVNAETIEDCNYIVFKNGDFSSKWYYAFIDRVEYVANETSRIYFTLDVMQTWFNQVTVQPCFIERSHVYDDSLGSNIVPESLEAGPYKDSVIKQIDFDKQICIVTTFQGSGDDVKPASGDMAYGIYSACKENYFVDASSANAFIEQAVKDGQAPDGIIGIYMVPKISSTGSEYGEYSPPSTIDGYTPKNNKLFTYPYCYLRLSTPQGDNHVYRFELSNNQLLKPKRTITLDYTVMSRGGQTTAMFTPLGYAIPDSNGDFLSPNLNETFAICNWPTCAYNTDIYKVYLAQNASAMAVQNAGMVTGALFSAANVGISAVKDYDNMNSGKSAYPESTFGAVEGLVNEGLSIAGTLAQRIDMDRLPPQTHGNINPYFTYKTAAKPELLPGMDCSAPVVQVSYRTITAEFAKIIDDYWSMYGYPIHEVQNPNIDCRTEWNYIKTQNCHCVGNVPPDAIATIDSIFNRGVTFWHNPGHVGNYEIDNPKYKPIPG